MNYLFNSLNDVFNNFDFLFSDDFNGKFYHEITDNTVNYPAIDMKYDKDFLYLILAVCGIKKEFVSVEMKEDKLNVKYDPPETKEENITYLRRKIAKRKFNLNFRISSKCDTKNIDAKVENGELIIKIPIKPEEFKKIEIK